VAVYEATQTAEEFTRAVTETSREAYTTIVENVLAAQEQNVRLALSTFENSVDFVRGQMQGSNGTMQAVVQQSQKQREVWGRLAYRLVDLSLDMWFAPLSYFEAARRATEKSHK
jgi:hypothetical protein